jgi:hypothetical protein
MKTDDNPNDHVRLVRSVRTYGTSATTFGGWGPRVPGL